MAAAAPSDEQLALLALNVSHLANCVLEIRNAVEVLLLFFYLPASQCLLLMCIHRKREIEWFLLRSARVCGANSQQETQYDKLLQLALSMFEFVASGTLAGGFVFCGRFARFHYAM